MKTRIKTIEWEEQKPTNAPKPVTLTGFINENEVAFIRATNFDDEGAACEYGCWMESPIPGRFSGTLDECKALAQSHFEAYVQSKMDEWFEPVPFQVTMITEGAEMNSAQKALAIAAFRECVKANDSGDEPMSPDYLLGVSMGISTSFALIYDPDLCEEIMEMFMDIVQKVQEGPK